MKPHSLCVNLNNIFLRPVYFKTPAGSKLKNTIPPTAPIGNKSVKKSKQNILGLFDIFLHAITQWWKIVFSKHLEIRIT